MPFNSYIFTLAFLPITVTGFFLLNQIKLYRIADVFLIAASLVFYSWYHKSYGFFLLLSVFVNYLIAKLIKTRIKNRRILLLFGLAINIGALFVLKYYNFFITSVNGAVGSSLRTLNLVLPIGISFYTFQQIAYIADTYKNPDMGGCSVLEYVKYATFFPYILEGPIAYHHEMIPQFRNEALRKPDYDNLSKGIWLFAIGMGKKVIIADTLGLLVDDSFSHIGNLGTIMALLVMLSYTMQIYFDFSGYCDMAAGVAKMFNIDLPLNFNSPYKALNISDFWKRWHMTLTRFFTKYVYIPLGGNRKGETRTYLNMLVVFLVSGLWHGANWTFVLWGAAHGMASLLTRALDRHTSILDTSKSQVKKFVLWIFTFIFVNLAWVMFRADTVADALAFYSQIFSGNLVYDRTAINEVVTTDGIVLISRYVPVLGKFIKNYTLLILMCAAVMLSTVFSNETCKIGKWKPKIWKSFTIVAIMVYCILSFSGISSFIYWKF